MVDRAAGSDLVGRALGHCRIVEKIGAGGMGDVYRAHDEHLDREVAIKVLPTGFFTIQNARNRFRKEALALSKLNHPNVATIYDFDTQDGIDFLVMELISGVTLDCKLAAGPLPEHEVVRLGIQLAEGLAAAHERGIVHRDLKPGNLRVTRDGWLKILDFGLAKLLAPASTSAATEPLTKAHDIIGTLPYMAPEQLLGTETDCRTDIYAVGVVLYEMATGQRPFAQTGTTGLISAILSQTPRLPSAVNKHISPELQRIIAKCMEKDPGNRYQSATELAIDLRRLGGSGGVVVPAGTRHQFPLRAAAVLIVVLLLIGVAIVGRGWRKSRVESSPPQIRSLAVLPFENTSHNPDQDYFADGMTDELINNLGNIQALRVISKTSSMQFRGSRKSLPEIARVLNVEGVVEGSVLLAGERVRITTQLVYAPNDQEIWASRYEGDLRDVLALQRQAALAIAGKIKVSLTEHEQNRLAGASQVSPQAYEAYLKGRYYWDRRDRASLEKSLQYFEQAVADDSSDALAFAGIADVYVLLGAEWSTSPKETNDKAKSAAQKALALDDSLAEAHASLAGVYHNEWNWQAAEREFKRATELNPNYATAHHWYSIYLASVGRFDESVEEANKAVALDPLSLIINTNLGMRLNEARRYAEAADQCHKTIDIDPNFGPGYFCLGVASLEQGKLKEGTRELENAVRRFPGNPLFVGQLGAAYGLSGATRSAQKMLRQLQASKDSAVPFYRIAMVYAGMGEKQQAIAALKRAYDQRSADLINLKVEPVFASIRPDPRVQDIIRRMGFPN